MHNLREKINSCKDIEKVLEKIAC